MQNLGTIWRISFADNVEQCLLKVQNHDIKANM